MEIDNEQYAYESMLTLIEDIENFEYDYHMDLIDDFMDTVIDLFNVDGECIKVVTLFSNREVDAIDWKTVYEHYKTTYEEHKEYNSL